MKWLMSPEVLIDQGLDLSFLDPSVTVTLITGKHTYIVA